MLKIETVAKNFKTFCSLKFARVYMHIGRYAPEEKIGALAWNWPIFGGKYITIFHSERQICKFLE